LFIENHNHPNIDVNQDGILTSHMISSSNASAPSISFSCSDLKLLKEKNLHPNSIIGSSSSSSSSISITNRYLSASSPTKLSQPPQLPSPPATFRKSESRISPFDIAKVKLAAVRLNHHAYVNVKNQSTSEVVPEYQKILESNCDEKEEFDLPYIIWDSGRKSGRVAIQSQEFFHIGSGFDNKVRISSPFPETVGSNHVRLYYCDKILKLSKFGGAATALPLYIISKDALGMEKTQNLCNAHEDAGFILKDGDRIQIGKGRYNYLKIDLSRTNKCIDSPVAVLTNSQISNSSFDSNQTSSAAIDLSPLNNVPFIIWNEKGCEKKLPVLSKSTIHVGTSKNSDIILKGSCVCSRSHVKFFIDRDGDLAFQVQPTGFDTSLISSKGPSLQCRDEGNIDRKLNDGDKIKVGELAKNTIRIDLSNVLSTPKKRHSAQSGSSEKKQRNDSYMHQLMM
jgi:hypothetical protein